jgi:Tfp pilus assembly protein PilX
MIPAGTAHRHLRAQDGFTMVVVLGVMLLTSLLIVAGLTASDHDIHLSYESASHTQSYYAALAGVQEYDYKLQNNPNYWETCEGAKGEAEGAYYEVKVLPAESAPTGTTACSASSPFTTAIEAKGRLANTFRIESTACSGANKLTSCQKQAANVQVRSVVATFQVTGFLDYAYFTQYEDEDYNLYGGSQAECETYYSVTREKDCQEIEFAPEDGVRGPMHTDDTANTCGEVEFGRKGEEPPDVVEINGGIHEEGSMECKGNPIFNTSTGSYTKGTELRAPESDSSLKLYVESANEFEGVTHLVLNGSLNTIEVINRGVKESPLPWPANGLIYVEKQQKSGVCTYSYKQVGADLANETTEEEGCGTVYVSGTYSKSLTIAAERNLIIDGNLTPTGVTLGQEPSGTETLGLIATQYVRIDHPVEETYAKSGSKCEEHNYGNHNFVDTEVSKGVCKRTNEYYAAGGFDYCDAENATGSLESPWIYAAILSTSHSFTVDNFDCGSQKQLGTLNIYGAIAQKFRGIVGEAGSPGHGYIKNYIYDERLATDEPPYFLAPLKAGWKIIRETAIRQG